eukprot:TRINITY_DN2755_c0_g1_i5.p1 TRINITY_DN2755_c0_g1~~TRINITY_DN2755_c0_g1_i5.p1  ORF type:complete len:132 (+),score=10.84 TRINITY_DN2755_c0_g1_i5:187-582(+)
MLVVLRMATTLEVHNNSKVCSTRCNTQHFSTVGIQEETISELTRSEDAGYNLLESMTKYYVTRAKLVTKVLKYPSIEDYRQSVDELDQKEYVNLRLSCLDMRNNMALCYDMLNKNIEKIITPRTSHSHALY